MPFHRDRKHITLNTPPDVESYKPYRKGMRPKDYPRPVSRPAHGAALRQALEQVRVEADQRVQRAGFQVGSAASGLYVQFESQPDVDLNTSMLEAARDGIELVAVTAVDLEDGHRIQLATVYVPEGAVAHLLAKFDKYSLSTPRKEREVRYWDAFDPVTSLRLATLRALWTDAPDSYPAEGQSIWWEVWLRRHDGREVERLAEFAGKVGIQLGEHRLTFTDRIVCLVYGKVEQLAISVDVLNDMAEVRKAKETAAFFVEESPAEQVAWSKDLVRRTTGPSSEAPAVCILDTGVNRGHPLLAAALPPADAMAVDPAWGSHDHDGHGTEMAGLALYGNLVDALAGSAPVVLQHRLESVKILPLPPAVNKPVLYGAVTAAATARVEIQAPRRTRCFSMAVTTEDTRDRGQPTSWSAAVDALAAGRSFDPKSHGLEYLPHDGSAYSRLFVLAAGNVSSPDRDHVARSDLEPVHDPGQAWNALTVGASTDLAFFQDPQWQGWLPVARPGDLSPWSTTSVAFAKEWPAKPDVVFEGGNVVVSGRGEIGYPVPELSLLTTYREPAVKHLVLSWATSAACAQVARMCAVVAAEYPSFWPETIRALVVHSAEWTERMKQHVPANSGKKDVARCLLRRFGHGVPDVERCLRSASNALTLIAQGTFRPFDKGSMREMHLFALPWPTAVLQGLGQVGVRLRVTLSYFVEPNPARRGWQKRFKYQSHGLRFEVKRPTESLDEFRKRINQKALDEEDDKPGAIQDRGWTLGELAQTRGSVHSDIWEGTAAELADRGVVSIYPVSGWWKDQKNRDRSDHGVRYALVVSIESPDVDVDIWTPVAAQVGVLTTVES